MRVLLVGREDVIRGELALHPKAAKLPIEIVAASEVITMEDSAAKAVRSKKDSSIRIACRLVRDGKAHGVVSAGDTCAGMATCNLGQGMIPGATRPTLASAFPTVNGWAVVRVRACAHLHS